MKKPRIGVVLGIFALLLMTVGCSALSNGKWAAKVNGEAILVKDLEVRVAEAQKMWEQQGYKFDNTEDGQKYLTYLKQQTLGSMIEAKLVGQEVKKLGLDPEDAKIIEQENEIKNGLSEEEFQEALKLEGIVEADLKNLLALMEKATENVGEVSEDEAKAFFEQNKVMYGKAEESVKARHILVKTEDEAQEIIAQLNAGVAFDQLAKEKSIEEAAKVTGGDLGEFTRGKMVPEFENAAFAQEVGVISATPVKTEFGYHVILVEAHNPAVDPDYEKDKDKVMEDVLNTKKNEQAQAFFSELYKNANIEYAKEYQPTS